MIVEKLMDYGRSFYTLLGERRKAERQEFTCSITVSCKNRYGQLTTHHCTYLNISAKGIGFASPELIRENTDVYIHSDTHNLNRFGRVRLLVIGTVLAHIVRLRAGTLDLFATRDGR